VRKASKVQLALKALKAFRGLLVPQAQPGRKAFRELLVILVRLALKVCKVQ
jgi:hypothetical protein